MLDSSVGQVLHGSIRTPRSFMVLSRFASLLSSSRRSSYKSGGSSSKQKLFDTRKLESMASGLTPEQQARTPGKDQADDRFKDSVVEKDEAGEDSDEVSSDSDVASDQAAETKSPKPRKITKPGEPAYVAPIPKIGSIPPISPGIPISSPGRPKLPPFVGSFLLGKTVDEYGDIVDDKTGQVLARAGGDLPSIVGRQISNRQGDILGDDGELLGYVADIEIERKGSGSGNSPSPSGATAPRSLFEIMSRSNASLMVDHLGNILDSSGNVVGKFHDNNNPLHRKEKEEKEAQQQSQPDEPLGSGKEEQPPPPPNPPPQSSPPPEEPEPSQSRPRRTEEERRENAQAWRKENPGESPSDIFLDVKSTTEGIQLTIRIPTVFGGQQVRPNISFS